MSHEKSISICERDDVSVPIKLTLSRPFANHTPDRRRQVYKSAQPNPTLTDLNAGSRKETTRTEYGGAIHYKQVPPTNATHNGKDTDEQQVLDTANSRPSNASYTQHYATDLPIETTVTMEEGARYRDVSPVTANDCCNDAEENKRHSRIDGQGETDNHGDHHHQRSSSASSSGSSVSGSSSDEDRPVTSIDEPEYPRLEDRAVSARPNKAKVDLASQTNVTKPVKCGPATSARRATQTIGTVLKQTDRGVIIEDDNILVRHESYNVVYKDTGRLYASVQAHMKSVLDEVKKTISTICETKLDTFRSNVDRLVKSETSRVRQKVTKNTAGKTEDSHRYAILTPKGQNGEIFHMGTAANRDDVNKKLTRCKNVEKLVLTFNDTEKFGVSHVRCVFKDNRMVLKSKNCYSFPGADMKELQAYLIKIFSRSKGGRVDGSNYKITYIDCADVPTTSSRPTANVSPSQKRTQSKRRESVRRSRNEEYTDPSADEELADERTAGGIDEDNDVGDSVGDVADNYHQNGGIATDGSVSDWIPVERSEYDGAKRARSDTDSIKNDGERAIKRRR